MKMILNKKELEKVIGEICLCPETRQKYNEMFNEYLSYMNRTTYLQILAYRSKRDQNETRD